MAWSWPWLLTCCSAVLKYIPSTTPCLKTYLIPFISFINVYSWICNWGKTKARQEIHMWNLKQVGSTYKNSVHCSCSMSIAFCQANTKKRQDQAYENQSQKWGRNCQAEPRPRKYLQDCGKQMQRDLRQEEIYFKGPSPASSQVSSSTTTAPIISK